MKPRLYFGMLVWAPNLVGYRMVKFRTCPPAVRGSDHCPANSLDTEAIDQNRTRDLVVCNTLSEEVVGGRPVKGERLPDPGVKQ